MFLWGFVTSALSKSETIHKTHEKLAVGATPTTSGRVLRCKKNMDQDMMETANQIPGSIFRDRKQSKFQIEITGLQYR